MKVIVAEKPSVARDIATFLGAKKRCDGYFEGSGFQVTWAFGHLVALKDPSEYDPSLKKWTLASLPIVPSQFELKIIEDQGSKKQFKIIKKLLEESSEIIAATDAGREGELIFRYILSLSGLEKKPFQRLWLSSLTDEAIQKAFDQLKPGTYYDALYAAAKCRSESDWIVGLNATRNFTVRFGKGSILWSVGRVQTPVLALIVTRDDEIRCFLPEPFWDLRTKYRGALFKCKKERFQKQSDALDLLQKIKDKPFTVLKVESKEEKVYPPSLYDLTELQREMNKKYGLSAQETLQTAQSLYESKWISYPRTDSAFLSSDMKEEVPKILAKLKSLRPKEIEPLPLEKLPFSPRIINDKKTGEHHAIIPTGSLPSSLSGHAEKVFQAILMRFIAIFYPPCLKEVTTVEGVSEEILFQAKGIQVVSPGWMSLYEKEKEDNGVKEEQQLLPDFHPKETGPHEPFIKEGKTEPPKHFTEASLLSAMETAGKFVEEEHLKEALKQKGLGTPATRASIIEVLLKRGYIVREKKNLIATSLGRYLIALIQDPNLKSPELTGEWECKLKEVEKAERDPALFMQEIVDYTKSLIRQSDTFRLEEKTLGACPRCKASVIEGKKGYGCSKWKEGCSFVLWKEYKGVVLTPWQVKQLLQRKILLDPVLIDTGLSILYLTEKGILTDIPVPDKESQKNTGKSSKPLNKKAKAKS